MTPHHARRATPRPPAEDAPRGSRNRLGLAAISLGFLMITLDATVVNVALRPIAADLGGSVATAQWVVNGYTLAFAAFLLSAGALADRVGGRTGYLVGLVVFAVGSAACSTAVSLDMLVAARILQGIGAAWLMPCSLALITHSFPEPERRRHALALWAGLSGVGLASGPLLGGILTDAIGWRAIFWINLPVAALAAGLLVRHVTETQRHDHRLDPLGQPLAVVTLSLLTSGFIVAGQRGWGDPLVLIPLGAGVLGGGLFVASQRTVAHAMIDPELFERSAFTVSVLIGLLFNFCLYGSLFCLALVLADAHGLSPFDTGLALLPMTILVGTTAFLSGRIVARIGEWRAIAVGMAAGATGAVLVAINPSHGSTLVLVLCTVPLGPMSMAMSAMTATAMAGTPPRRIGLASGVLNTARQTGGAFGVGILGTLLRMGGGFSLRDAFTGVAIASVLGVMLALAGRRRAVASARRATSASPTGGLPDTRPTT